VGRQEARLRLHESLGGQVMGRPNHRTEQTAFGALGAPAASSPTLGYMKYRTAANLSFALLLAVCGVAGAQQPIAMSPDIAAVVTGGRWQSGALSGTYRVVVRNGGFEHVVSYAQVDWITDSSSRDEAPRVIDSQLAATGSWLLDRPRIIGSGSAWRVEFNAVETHLIPAARGRWVVRLGPPGKLDSVLVQR
jgi:hypothetical protein